MDPHHEVVVSLRVIDAPGAAEPAVIRRVRRIVNDPSKCIFSRPVAVGEWPGMAGSRITLKGVELLLSHNRHKERQKKKSEQEWNYERTAQSRPRIDFTNLNSSNREPFDASFACEVFRSPGNFPQPNKSRKGEKEDPKSVYKMA